jgi:hypothetical protein
MGVYAMVHIDPSDTITGVTYDGNTMTQRQKNTVDGTKYIYEWIGTTTSGAKDVVVTASSGTIYLSVITFTSVNAFDAGANNSDFGSDPLALPITTIADNCYALAIAYDGGQGAPFPTSNNADTTKAGANGDYGGITIFYSTNAITPAGAFDLNLDVGTGGTNSWAIISFSPASAGPGAGSDSMRTDLSESSANLIRVTVPEETP